MKQFSSQSGILILASYVGNMARINKRVALSYDCQLHEVMEAMYGTTMKIRCRKSFNSLDGIRGHYIGHRGSTCRHIMDYIREQHDEWTEEYMTVNSP